MIYVRDARHPGRVHLLTMVQAGGKTTWSPAACGQRGRNGWQILGGTPPNEALICQRCLAAKKREDAAIERARRMQERRDAEREARG